MKQDILDKLLFLAEKDNFPALERAHLVWAMLLEGSIEADRRELQTARLAPSNVIQIAEIFAAIDMQGNLIVLEVEKLARSISDKFAMLAKCVETPRKMSRLGREWRQQSAKVEEMVGVAERLANQPDWKGKASEAHLAVIPKQIQAMKDLQALTATASESVILVGAIQSNIFHACTLVFAEGIDGIKGLVSQAPAAFFSRSAALVGRLRVMDSFLGSWLSGEGTWLPSAEQIARRAGVGERDGSRVRVAQGGVRNDRCRGEEEFRQHVGDHRQRGWHLLRQREGGRTHRIRRAPLTLIRRVVR